MKAVEFFNVLNAQNLSQLEKTVGVSRQALHNAINSRNMKLDNLSAVAKALNFNVEFVPIKSEENLLRSLCKFGAPLAYSKDGSLTFDQAVSDSLKRAREDGIYESVLPYLLFLNVSHWEPLNLTAVAFNENEVNVLGYFAEMANRFRPHDKIKYLLQLLRPAKKVEIEFLVLSTHSHFPELFAKNKLALKWNLKVRGSEEDHFARWEKWERFQEKN